MVGAGRNRARLEELLSEGADAIVPLAPAPEVTAAAYAEVRAEVDVVLDYVGARRRSSRWRRYSGHVPSTRGCSTGCNSADAETDAETEAEAEALRSPCAVSPGSRAPSASWGVATARHRPVSVAGPCRAGRHSGRGRGSAPPASGAALRKLKGPGQTRIPRVSAPSASWDTARVVQDVRPGRHESGWREWTGEAGGGSTPRSEGDAGPGPARDHCSPTGGCRARNSSNAAACLGSM